MSERVALAVATLRIFRFKKTRAGVVQARNPLLQLAHLRFLRGLRHLIGARKDARRSGGGFFRGYSHQYSANFFNVFRRKQVRFLSWKFEN